MFEVHQEVCLNCMAKRVFRGKYYFCSFLVKKIRKSLLRSKDVIILYIFIIR